MRRVHPLLIAFFSLLPAFLFAQSADSLYQAGQKAFQDRLFRIARESFAQLVRDYPEDPQADDAEYYAAVCSFYLGEYAHTLEPLRTFERRYPRSLWVARIQYWRGSALIRLEQFGEAVTALDRQLDEYPQEAWFRLQSLLLKGGALERLGRLKESAAAYRLLVQEPAAKSQGDLLPEALFRLGGVELRLEGYGEARKLFSRLLLEFPADARAAETVFFLAESQYFLGDLEEARKRYARYADGSPAGAGVETARYRLARIALRQVRLAEALDQLALLEKGFGDGQFRREIPALRGEALFGLKRYGEAAAAWRRALAAAAAPAASASPQERQNLAYNLALAAREAGDGAGALDAWRQAQEGPDTALRRESLYREGVLLRESGRPAEALQALRRYAAEVPEGEAHLEDALRLQGDLLLQASDFEAAAEIYTRLLLSWPDSVFRAEYLFRRANAYLSQGDVPRALKDFQKVVTLAADGGASAGSAYVPESLYSIGYAYASGHEYARALPYFDQVLAALEPAAAPGGGPKGDLAGRTLLAQGVCFYNMERYPEALAAFRRLTAGDRPAQWMGEGWFHLGRTLYRMEKLEEAVDGFSRAADALAGRPEGAEALFWQGNGEFRLGRTGPARDTFLRLVREHPKESRVGESLYRAALCESRLGHPAETVSLLDRALGVGGLEADLKAQILYEKGWGQFQLGRRREAAASFEALRKEAPGSPLVAEGFYRMAEADFQARGYREALAGFQRAQHEGAGGETAVNARYWIGLCALQLDQKAAALQGFWEYLKVRPDGPYREPALTRVREVLAADGSEEAGRRFYRQVEADTAVPLPLRNLVRLEYARALFPHRLPEAGAVLEKIRASRPAEPLRGEADLLTGRWYQGSGELERALDIFTGMAGSRKDRFGASAQLGAGLVLEELGRKEDAAAEYLKVGFLYPDFTELVAESLFRAGRVYESLDRGDEARRLYGRLRSEYPHSPWLKELPGT